MNDQINCSVRLIQFFVYNLVVTGLCFFSSQLLSGTRCSTPFWNIHISKGRQRGLLVCVTYLVCQIFDPVLLGAEPKAIVRQATVTAES